MASAHIAIDCDVTCFSIDFRNAPETKAPQNIMDCYAGLKWVIDHAERFNIDRSRIAIAGESGGGYLCAGVAMQLAKNDESHLVKLCVPDKPMIYHGWVTKEFCELDLVAQWSKKQHLNTLKLLCANWQKQFNEKDPYIFPAEMGHALLAKVPPHVVCTREFDQFRGDAEYYANRLKKEGKLLELYIQPKTTHYS